MTAVLLAGLATVDVVQRVAELPGPGEKAQSVRVDLAAGGPATNAAVTVAALGGRPRLLTALGCHPLAGLASRDVAEHGVELVDLLPEHAEPPTLSAVTVRERDGERTVTSYNAAARDLDAAVIASALRAAPAVGAVLLDGHHPALALAVASWAGAAGLPVVLDAGTYRPVFAALLPMVDVCACSAAFRLPDRAEAADTERALLDLGIAVVTRTSGAEPVRWRSAGEVGVVDVPAVSIVRDTLGAGDVWHGALVTGIARLGRVPTSTELPAMLALANRVAALRVRHIGPRSWVDEVRTLAE